MVDGRVEPRGMLSVTCCRYVAVQTRRYRRAVYPGRSTGQCTGRYTPTYSTRMGYTTSLQYQGGIYHSRRMSVHSARRIGVHAARRMGYMHCPSDGTCTARRIVGTHSARRIVGTHSARQRDTARRGDTALRRDTALLRALKQG